MQKILIFGAGAGTENELKKLIHTHEVIAIIDNAPQKWGQLISNYPIISPNDIKNFTYDGIYILSSAFVEIRKQLLAMGIANEKIMIDTSITLVVNARIQALESFAKEAVKFKLEGSIAECGVYRGDFSSEINKFFPKNIFYLFDTFEGFHENDIKIESEENFSKSQVSHLNNTSIEIVLSKMINKDNCIICKGFFPETAQGINDKFIFVNIDFDLYKPTYEALKFFIPKMLRHGAIFVHDYFSKEYTGVQKAVDEIREEYEIKTIPIGDGSSIALVF